MAWRNCRQDGRDLYAAKSLPLLERWPIGACQPPDLGAEVVGDLVGAVRPLAGLDPVVGEAELGAKPREAPVLEEGLVVSPEDRAGVLRQRRRRRLSVEHEG